MVGNVGGVGTAGGVLPPNGIKMSLQANANSAAAAAVVSAAVSVASLGGAYNLSGTHVVGDDGNGMSGATTMGVPQPGSLYQNHQNVGSTVAKMAVYGTHGNADKVGDVFHTGVNHVGTKMTTTVGDVYHQHRPDSGQDAVDRTPSQPDLVGSYHVPSYVPAGLPMASMGYYIPPIHHTDPGMDLLHNRMANNQ